MTSFGVLDNFQSVANAGSEVSKGKGLLWFFMSVVSAISVAYGEEKHHDGECVVQENCSWLTTDNFSGMLPTVAYFLLIVQPNYGLTSWHLHEPITFQ